jgi:hypothetical protein
MRDLLSKLDAIVSETELKNPEDLQAKRKALADLEKDPVASDDPEISSAITQRKTDLEREAKSKGFAESFQIGDAFGISFSEDFEIGTEIVGFLEDGIVVELDDHALDMLTNEGLEFLEGELEESVAGPKKCWKGYRKTGTQPGTGKNAGKRVNDCEKIGEDHGPENPDAPVNYGEYDREGDMAKDDLRTIDDAAEELYSILQADDNLPEWVQAKITKAVDYIDTARDYMKAQNYEEGIEEAGSPAQQAAIAINMKKHHKKPKSEEVDEAKYHGREVPLGKKMAGDVKKSKVYVRKPNGNIVKVNFGDKKMRIKKSNPARRKSFRARHNCANPGPRDKARYWSCRSW